ncbi:MAG: hypothetical protein JSR60_13825 [Proteobacteria bacterium]|nr:hypothetical protein [Pseudomonadota bacterium]
MSDLLDDELEKSSGGVLDLLKTVVPIWRQFRLNYRLLLLLFPFFFCGALLLIATAKPTYTATAVLGPTVTLSDTTGGNNIQNLARRFGGGLLGGAGMSDTFSEFTALLDSNRLSGALARNPAVMHVVFDTQWDSDNNRWKSRSGYLAESIDAIKRLIGRPVKAEPDQDDLLKFLESRMVTSTSLDTGYATISLTFQGREETTQLLTQILKTADDIIREDKRRDVAARIAYLHSALGNLAVTNERDALIQTLSDQDQKMMIISSDHRYASTYIDPPYAPARPSSPNPYEDVLIALVLAVATWFGVVYFAREGGRVHGFLEWLGGRHRNARAKSNHMSGPAGATVHVPQVSQRK